MERGCDNRLITFHAASALRVIGGVSCLSLRDSYHDVPQQLSSPLLYLPPPKAFILSKEANRTFFSWWCLWLSTNNVRHYARDSGGE